MSQARQVMRCKTSSDNVDKDAANHGCTKAGVHIVLVDTRRLRNDQLVCRIIVPGLLC